MPRCVSVSPDCFVRFKTSITKQTDNIKIRVQPGNRPPPQPLAPQSICYLSATEPTNCYMFDVCNNIFIRHRIKENTDYMYTCGFKSVLNRCSQPFWLKVKVKLKALMLDPAFRAHYIVPILWSIFKKRHESANLAQCQSHTIQLLEAFCHTSWLQLKLLKELGT